MFGAVLEQPIAPVDIFDRETRNGLEPSPTNRENQRVVVLQESFEPTMLLQTDLHQHHRFFVGLQTTEHNGSSKIDILYKFTWHTAELNAHIHTRTISFILRSTNEQLEKET